MPNKKGRKYENKYAKWQFKVVRVPADTFDPAGCVRMVGAVVKAAIQDAAAEPITSAKLLHQIDAYRFLFDAGVLEAFFSRYHLDNHANCAMIRQGALNIIQGLETLTDDTDDTDSTETDDLDND